MASNESNNVPLSQAIIALVIIGAAGWFFFGGGLEQQAQADLQNVHAKVATDAIAQYEIVKRSGSKMDLCMHSGLVAAAYLQAQDEGNYKTWKATQDSDCKKAGMPM